MNSILIATKNISKFELIVNFFKFSNIFLEYNFICLKNVKDLNIVESAEKGNILKRAKQKVVDIVKNNLDENINKYKYIIGIDDGIKIKNKIIENVKEIIPSVVNDELLKKDEIVYICRAFSIYDVDKKCYNNIITKIPFKYKKFNGNLNDLKNISYPLSYVLCDLNSSIPIIETNKKEENEYYKIYSSKLFKY